MTDPRDKIRNPNCDLCPLHEGAQFVCLMGSGPTRAKVMIVGEAPGAREDESHEAFVGQAGKFLNAVLEDVGKLKRDQCYVTNVAKCRPPGNRTPHKTKEVKICVDAYFDDEVMMVRPKFMLLLGNAALHGVTKKSGITKHAGTIHRMDFGDGRAVQVFPTLHPAAVLRNPKYGDQFIADIKRFGKLVRGDKSGQPETKIKIVRTKAHLRALCHHLEEAKEISWDIETYTQPREAPYVRTNFQDWHGDDSQIGSVAFSWEEGLSWVVPLWHPESPFRKIPNEVLEVIRPYMVREDAKYIGHNGKFDARWFHSKGIPVPQSFDTMLAAHMLEENRSKGLKPLSKVELGAPAYDVGEELKNLNKISLRRLCIYNGKDTDYTLRLKHRFQTQLVEDQPTARLFARLMMPASEMLVDVERHGVWIDPERWQERHDIAHDKVAQLYRYLNQFVPEDMRPINLNSPQQVGKWLYEHLELPVLETTDAGHASTREGVLLELVDRHKAVRVLMKYRKWAKFLSTYLLPWWFEHRDERGRIHSNYKLFGTVTGRLSGEGGIQQVPRDPFIRSIIGAPEGWKFVQADYSQIELRIAAMEANAHKLIRQFYSGQDVHMAGAMKITGKLAKDISKEERKRAKARNFGYLYGMGYSKFVTYAFENYDIRITEAEAEADRDSFFEDYPELLRWHERQRRLARRYKQVRSPLGRVRHLPDILSQSNDVAGESERQAINSPIQSMASDMMLMSMVELHGNHLNPKHARIVGTVHDSILFEVREDKVDKYAGIIKSTMEDTDRVKRNFGCDVTVPIVADIEIGSHWGEGEPWQPK